VNKHLAVALECIASIVFLVSVFLVGLALAICLLSGHGWLGLLLTGLVLAVSSAAVGGYCLEVLERQSVEHEGVVASIGQIKEKRGVVIFDDGYISETDLALTVEPGLHLTIWRDGRDKLKRIEVKRA